MAVVSLSGMVIWETLPDEDPLTRGGLRDGTWDEDPGGKAGGVKKVGVGDWEEEGEGGFPFGDKGGWEKARVRG